MKNDCLQRNFLRTSKKYACALCACVISIAGCLSMTGEMITTPEYVERYEIADNVMQQLFQSYQNFTRPQFEDQVSPDFMPMRSAFISEAEEGAYANRIISMDYFIDKALERGDTLAVTCKWEKKMVPQGASGSTILKGTAQFIFVEELERWTLKQVKGNNPFKK